MPEGREVQPMVARGKIDGDKKAQKPQSSGASLTVKLAHHIVAFAGFGADPTIYASPCSDISMCLLLIRHAHAELAGM